MVFKVWFCFWRTTWSWIALFISLDLKFCICCCCSVAKLCLTLCDPMDWSMPGFIPCLSPSAYVCSDSCPLSHWCYLTSCPLPPLFLLSSVFSRMRVFFNELAFLIRWPKYWSFSLISPFNEYSGLISFGIASLVSLLSNKLSRVFSSITIQKHQFFGAWPFMVQLSHPCMTAGKTIALTTWTFVSKVMSLFNTLWRFVTAFLPSASIF